jgi:hypothetical protein
MIAENFMAQIHGASTSGVVAARDHMKNCFDHMMADNDTESARFGEVVDILGALDAECDKRGLGSIMDDED